MSTYVYGITASAHPALPKDMAGVEYNVKAMHDEEAVLHRVMSQSPEIRTLTEANRQAGGGSYEQKLRIGEMVVAAVDSFRRSRPHLEVRVNGPLPPYSFVEPGPTAPASTITGPRIWHAHAKGEREAVGGHQGDNEGGKEHESEPEGAYADTGSRP